MNPTPEAPGELGQFLGGFDGVVPALDGARAGDQNERQVITDANLADANFVRLGCRGVVHFSFAMTGCA